MHHPAIIRLLVLAGAALLAFAAVHDIGFRTVPNRVSIGILICGLVLRLLAGDLFYGVLCGAIIFCFTYGFWRLGWMGGADVKLLTASAVFVPPLMVPTLVIGTSLAGGVLALVYVVGSGLVPRRRAVAYQRRPAGLLRRAMRCELRRLRRRGPLPYAAAIATGGWLAIASSS